MWKRSKQRAKLEGKKNRGRGQNSNIKTPRLIWECKNMIWLYLSNILLIPNSIFQVWEENWWKNSKMYNKCFWWPVKLYISKFSLVNTVILILSDWHGTGVILGRLGNTSQEKNRFLSGIAQKGGGRALPEFFYPFFHHVVPYILTSISCYVILFGHF